MKKEKVKKTKMKFTIPQTWKLAIPRSEKKGKGWYMGVGVGVGEKGGLKKHNGREAGLRKSSTQVERYGFCREQSLKTGTRGRNNKKVPDILKNAPQGRGSKGGKGFQQVKKGKKFSQGKLR